VWFVRFSGFGGTLLAACLASASARAAEGPLPLRVERTASAQTCADATTLAAVTNQTTNRATLDPDAPDGPVKVIVAFSHDKKTGYTATIKIVGGERAGERTLNDVGPKCDDLAEAVVTTLVIMLEESAPPPPAPAKFPDPPPVPPPLVIEPSKPIDRPPPPSPKPGNSLLIGAHAGASSGWIGGAAPFAELEAMYGRTITVGLSGFAVLPQRHPASPTADVDLSMFAGSVSGCYAMRVCALFGAGTIRARTQGLIVDSDKSRAWLAGGLSGRYDFPLGSTFLLGVRMAAWLPIVRHSFEVTGAGMVYRPPTVAVSVDLALTVKIF
jgi:hypothetical protein